jgi:arsenate reductase (thioredoxin)
MFEKIKKYTDELVQEFDLIPNERKVLLERISHYIAEKKSKKKEINLMYVCTHNSRRSHFGQIWAAVATDYYNIPNVNTFSGGTEATAFNINAINSLKRVGFKIEQEDTNDNPRYRIFHDDSQKSSVCFSKVYDHPQNPEKEFAAIMTCGDAEENCPFIPGVELRIATTYEDPKTFDNTAQQDEKYDERCKQIARETMYVFFKTKDLRQKT